MPTVYMPLMFVGYVHRQLCLHVYDQVLSALCFLGISYVFLMCIIATHFKGTYILRTK